MYSIVRMSNGDELIAQVVDRDSSYITVEDPFRLIYSHEVLTSRTIVSLIRFIPFAQTKTINIYLDHVTCEAPATEDIIKHYEETIKEYERAEKYATSKQAQKELDDLEREIEEQLKHITSDISANTTVH